MAGDIDMVRLFAFGSRGLLLGASKYVVIASTLIVAG